MTPVVDLVRATVAWIGWQSLAAAVVFAAVTIVARVVCRARPTVQSALWGVVLVRLVLPLDLASPVSARALIDRLVAPGPGHAIGGVDVIAAGRSVDSVQASQASAASALDPVVLLALVWLAGSAFVAIRTLAARRRYLRAAAAARIVADDDLRPVLDEACRRLGVRRTVRLRITDAPVEPFTVGVLRPEVILPAPVASRPELAATVITHELAHVRRLDVAWMAVERMLAVVYWFHPAVWISLARRHEARERACDVLVLERGSVPARRYAFDLLAVVRLGLAPVAAPAASLPKRRLDMRLRSILRADTASRRSPFAAAIVVVTAVLSLPLASPAATPRAAVAASDVDVSATSVPEMHHPLPDGRLTWGWGPGRDPFTGDEAHHRGVDLAAPLGTPVHAAASGTVVEATDTWSVSPSSGTVVVLDHGDGWSTVYTHLDSFEVEAGDDVVADQTIGRVGSSGRSTGPHLHFEVRRDGEPVDPATVVERLRR